jgi:hypothetical protein
VTMPEKIRAELLDLLWKFSDGSIAPAEMERIERLAFEHPEAYGLYALFAGMCGVLEWEHSSLQEVGASSSAPPLNGAPPASLPAPVTHSPLFGLPGLFGGAAVCYALAALILGVGLLAAWAWRMPDHWQVASLCAAPTVERDKDGTPLVGTITRTFGCRWADPGTATMRGGRVPLGRKYALRSGLMEIAYATGAKVVIQGPAVYEVESKNGGYLSLGRLTVRFEGQNEQPGAGPLRPGEAPPNAVIASQPSHGASAGSRPASSPFFIRTPLGTVTSPDAQYLVDIVNPGFTNVRVFRGRVELEPLARATVVKKPKRVEAIAWQDLEIMDGRDGALPKAGRSIVN